MRELPRSTTDRGYDADKGVFLIVLFVCVPFCIIAGLVVWMAG